MPKIHTCDSLFLENEILLLGEISAHEVVLCLAPFVRTCISYSLAWTSSRRKWWSRRRAWDTLQIPNLTFLGPTCEICNNSEISANSFCCQKFLISALQVFLRNANALTLWIGVCWDTWRNDYTKYAKEILEKYRSLVACQSIFWDNPVHGWSSNWKSRLMWIDSKNFFLKARYLIFIVKAKLQFWTISDKT